ncbi:nucleotide sugar dehydrogenase [Halosegnis marinus]|uniref:UDP-N-acetyl-D-mannosamine dehydrogenase n=1 Tax=Halosegnis marinus TaxID=3034023 RepID=A0ABD5ZRQ1_9EURY|nr:nucleotide sugar dehydrogenase [Halosegnis sp. DT85]
MSRATTASVYGDGIPAAVRRQQFVEGAVPVAVYGLGKMGLPLAAVFASVTGNATGVDIDPDRVAAVNDGDAPVGREPGLGHLVADTVATGALSATTDGEAAAADARVHVVIVPTTVDDDGLADLSALRSVVDTVAAGLSPGDLVVVESTVPPRTCADTVAPLLERGSGLSAGEYGLAFCPERTSSGRALRDIGGAYPKVVGGVDAESTRAARLVYEHVTTNEVVAVADATTAECVKVFEGIYRDVNIALANELARFADDLGADVRAAIDTANTQPFCAIHDPGIGVGGHCIPYYPYFLLSEFGRDAPLTRTARAVNDGMPLFAVRELTDRLADRGTSIHDARVLVLGAAYRAGVAETRKSPAMPVTRALADDGATLYLADPVLDDLSAFPAEAVALADLPELDVDAAVLVTAHPEFEGIDWGALGDLVVVDGRDAVDPAAVEGEVYTVGRGERR